VSSKGIDALELIFALFILIIVSLVVIRMVTQYVTVKPILDPIKRWTDSYNYQAARSQCETLCDNFRKDCDPSAAVTFCTQKADVDLNKDTRVGQKGVGNLVNAIPFCEDGIYCFHIYPDCECGQILTATDCLQILCNYYQSSAGYDPEISMKAVQSEITWGTCNPNVVKNNMTGKRADSWWKDAAFDSKSCDSIGGERLTPTQTTTGQLSKFTLSNCQVNSVAKTFRCDATGSCSNGMWRLTDSSGTVDGFSSGIISSTFSGALGPGINFIAGSCTFEYTCYDPGKQQTITASGCAIT